MPSRAVARDCQTVEKIASSEPEGSSLILGDRVGMLIRLPYRRLTFYYVIFAKRYYTRWLLKRYSLCTEIAPGQRSNVNH